MVLSLLFKLKPPTIKENINFFNGDKIHTLPSTEIFKTNAVQYQCFNVKFQHAFRKYFYVGA